MKMNYLNNLALYIAFAFLMQGCSSDDNIASANSYYVDCDKGRNCGVFNSEGPISVVIEPEVDGYLVEGKYIAGHSSPENLTPLPGVENFVSAQARGYFIVDTEKDTWETGMNERQWRDHLQKLGIKNPHLNAIER